MFKAKAKANDSPLWGRGTWGGICLQKSVKYFPGNCHVKLEGIFHIFMCWVDYLAVPGICVSVYVDVSMQQFAQRTNTRFD